MNNMALSKILSMKILHRVNGWHTTRDGILMHYIDNKTTYEFAETLCGLYLSVRSLTKNKMKLACKLCEEKRSAMIVKQAIDKK